MSSESSDDNSNLPTRKHRRRQFVSVPVRGRGISYDSSGDEHDDSSLPLMTDFQNQEAAAGSSVSIAPSSSVAATPSGSEPSQTGSDAPLRNPATATSSTPELSVDSSTVQEEQQRSGHAGHDGETSTPRFIQEQGTAGRRWKWIPYPVRRVYNKVEEWVHGPVPPVRYAIKPIFPSVQEYPLRLMDRFLPKRRQRIWATFALFSVWLIIFSLVKNQEESKFEIQGWGVPRDIGCGATYWSAGNGCGVNGDDCRPFQGSGFPFRCAASCENYHVLNPRAVGTQEVIYAPFVVGGPPEDGNVTAAFYRGDSHICNAAIHAGIISNMRGGCGVIQLAGTDANYTASKRNGISSVGFDSYFPLTYMFSDGIECSAIDNRWTLLGITVALTVILSIFTASPALFFFPAFTMMFWEVGLASDQPGHSSTAGLVSTILGRFLPAMFCAWVMFDRMGVRRTLDGLTAQIEKTVLWLGGAWVSCLDNYTWSQAIPIQRLNGHDLQQQPGAKAALAIIVIVLFFIIVSQIWFFRKEGRLTGKLKFYGLILFGILISLSLPGLSLRIHHYIIGLVLLPATALQTRPSLLFQGLLVGWFINGVARWGFDSVLQTAAELQQDAQLGSPLPEVLAPIIALAANATSSITFQWGAAPASGSYDGISVLVNDVERFRGYFSEGADSMTWDRDADLGLPEYFRFAYMSGTSTQDYTKAGTWTANGTWIQMAEGPS